MGAIISALIIFWIVNKAMSSPAPKQDGYSKEADKDFRNYCRAVYGDPDYFGMYGTTKDQNAMKYEKLDDKYIEPDSPEIKKLYYEMGVKSVDNIDKLRALRKK